MRSFEEQLAQAKIEFKNLGDEMERLAIEKNNLAKQRAVIHERIAKLEGVIELTKPSF